MPRFIASRATSAGVQWLTGNSLSCGFSQASATIAVSCSGVNLGGVPARGASDNADSTKASSSVSLAPSASAASSRCCHPAQRTRHRLTRCASVFSSSICFHVATLLADISTIRARTTKSCPVLLARTHRCRISPCRFDTASGVARRPTRSPR